MAVVSLPIPYELGCAAQADDTFCVSLDGAWDFWSLSFDTVVLAQRADYHIMTQTEDMSLRLRIRDGVCYAVIWREVDNYKDVKILTPDLEWITAS